MIARLQRFYGGDPVAWLRAPMYLLRVLAANLPAIRAEELLASRAAVALGTGSLKPDAAARIERAWLDAADELAPRGRGVPLLDALSALDVPVSIEKVRRPR